MGGGGGGGAGLVGGAAGGPPPPIGAWGGATEAFTFFASNHAKNQRIRSAVNF